MVKTKRGRLTEYLKEIFQRDSEWGLATFLLHEVHRGEDSPWAPFIKTLRMRLMRSSVIAELEGTWAAELQRTWDEDAQTIMNQMKARHDSAEHFSRLNALLCTDIAWIFIPAYCFAKS